MRGRKPPSTALVERAAAFRFDGLSWADVARQLGISVHTVSKWPKAYPELWKTLLCKAERQQSEQDFEAAVATLARLSHHENPRLRVKAAARLAWLRLRFRKFETVPVARTGGAAGSANCPESINLAP